MRNTIMSFAEETGEMKLAMDKNWHTCFVSMDLKHTHAEKVKQLVKGLFADELLYVF